MRNKNILMGFLMILFIGNLASTGQIKTNSEVKSLIKKKREFNKKNGYGFRIQLDNGLETQVKTTQEKFNLEYPLIKTYILFESPEWKVQVGNYKTRIQADKNLKDIKQKFPTAIVVPR